MVSEVGLLMAWSGRADGAGGRQAVGLTASQAGRADGAGGRRRAVGRTASQLVELTKLGTAGSKTDGVIAG